MDKFYCVNCVSITKSYSITYETKKLTLLDSTNWVLFQPNIVIDAKLGCMWYLHLDIESLCNLISDRIRLTEFLLQRNNGKQALLKVLRQLVDDQYNGAFLPVLETIFNKINKVYAYVFPFAIGIQNIKN